MSATYRLFTRWKEAKGFKSERAACLALGLSSGTVVHWKGGRNGEPEYIEKMAHDLGEDPVKTILEAYAEQKTGNSQRVLVKLSKRFGAVVLTLFMIMGATVKPNEINGGRAFFSHKQDTLYIMYERILRAVQLVWCKVRALWTESRLMPHPA